MKLFLLISFTALIGHSGFTQKTINNRLVKSAGNYYCIDVVEVNEAYVRHWDSKNSNDKPNEYIPPFFHISYYTPNPVVWDVYEGHMYGISILHTNRQPYQHLIRMAKVPLEDLPKIELVYGAIGFNKYSLFDVHIYSAPMPFIKKIYQKKYSNIFFDINIPVEDSLSLFVQYDYQLYLSAYSRKAKTWTEINCYDTDFNGIFNAIQLCGTVYIIDNEGITYTLKGDKLVKQNTKVMKN
ncbi:MAG: hypothetical protein AB8B69_17685, partial [Chitinophagales bacterium]